MSCCAARLLAALAVRSRGVVSWWSWSRSAIHPNEPLSHPCGVPVGPYRMHPLASMLAREHGARVAGALCAPERGERVSVTSSLAFGTVRELGRDRARMKSFGLPDTPAASCGIVCKRSPRHNPN